MVERFHFPMLMVAVLLGASSAGEVFAQSSTRDEPQRSTYGLNQLNRVTSSSNISRYSSNQFKNQIVNRTVPQFGYSTANRGLARDLRQTAFPSKPFSGVSRGPSVTPYLGLSRPFGGVSDVYDVRRRANMQREQQQQQRLNERQQRQNIALQRQLNQIAAQGPYNTEGSETMAPTGHAAEFMQQGGYHLNYGGYYSQ